MRQDKHDGESAYHLLEELYPIARSLTGNGVRKTLFRIQEDIPIEINEVPSGYNAYDWVVPDEWNINDAYVISPDGDKIIDFKENNLYVLYYSTPFEGKVSLDELKKHTYTKKEQPDVIPFVASYYKRKWGICMSKNQLDTLEDGVYKVVIDASLSQGFLTYGEVIVKGASDEEILLSTYICHPSLANDNLSGVVVTAKLVEYIASLTNPRYTYRIIFIPETIGSLVYMSKNLPHMKKHTVAGYTVTCVGDSGDYSYLSTRWKNKYVDKVTIHVLRNIGKDYLLYDYQSRGSDERQFSSPGADLPIGSLMKSKYHEYKEYHTSADNLDYVTIDGLNESITAYKLCIDAYEHNKYYTTNVIGEAQLSKRGLYPTTFQEKQSVDVNIFVDFMAYADGTNDLIDIAELIKKPVWDLYSVVSILIENELIYEVKNKHA